MMPGLAFLYSGLVRRKHALSMLLTVMLSWVVVSFQWFFWVRRSRVHRSRVHRSPQSD